MQQRTVHIPGKLMLVGEYAVLDGAPAILACVDPKVQLSAEFGAESRGRLEILADERLQNHWHWEHGALVWDSPSPPMLVDALLQAFPNGSLSALRIDSRELFDGGRKLGLGSSAAAAVAIGAVLAGDLGSTTVARIADAHRHFQGGVGSGADIHAVARGGVVRFQRNQSMEALGLPNELLIQPVIAPQSVSTPGRIARFRRWQETHSGAIALGERLAAEAEQVAENWMKATADEILVSMRAYLKTMSEISTDAQLEYLSGGHAQLLPLAQACEVVYKPCGAGGGDIGIAMATESAALDRFRAGAVARGFSVPAWRVGQARPSGDGVTGAAK